MNSCFYNGQNNENTHKVLTNNGIPVLDFGKSRQVDNSSSLSARNLSAYALSSTSRRKSPYRLGNTINMNSSIVFPHNKYNLNPAGSTFNKNIPTSSSSSSYRPIIIESNYTKSPLNNRG
jgi:hypothetical protein